MSCQCLVHPPVFDLPPPPDLSLVWNLISDDVYEPQTDCEWGPFITITDVSSKISSTPLYFRSLITVSIIASMILLSLCLTAICRIKRGRSRRKTTKSTSSDGILTAADNVWTYNSMKNSCSGSTNVLVCNGTTHNQAYQNTPGTIRSYATNSSMKPAAPRSCTSTTLHLRLRDDSAAYYTVGRCALSPAESYEEIPPRGFHASYQHKTTREGIENSSPFMRESCRRPPPTCRPPPIPLTNISNEFSPHGSDQGSIDRELAGISTDSPLQRSEEGERRSGEGRESGYGTAPSRQWRSPPTRSDDVTRMPICLFSQATNIHSMTYV
ncbi:hypothetical protein KIN20_016073 [Parelaphostrongylus tenuis]|uniref:Uncharacterized protein n=1 Tax=Parelaphostrongylus tenuis TaxID=148309 RepID=A0AAD5N0Z4_PARTN|nr:hypothetical protein KIN20_016073 [Parelaphostrongylus tenuis]